MTSLPPNTTDPRPPAPPPGGPRTPLAKAWRVIARILADRDFVVAAVLLAVIGLGWKSTISALNWAMMKTPVAWPKDVTVSDDFRLTSLPIEFGDYRMVTEDGVLFRDRAGKPVRDGKPDGEGIIPEEQRLILGVGTHDDAPRLAARSSNWYVSRIYEDKRQPVDSPFRLWQLDVTYYTGAVDNVAHEPWRCMIAAGAVPSGAEEKVSVPVDESSRPWDPNVDFIRARFSKKGYPGEFVQYYTFSLNGLNESSVKRVRWHLASNPWEKHCYFAKIQFGPKRLVRDSDLRPQKFTIDGKTYEFPEKIAGIPCDEAARKFVRAFLPEVLRALPSNARIVELNSGGTNKPKEVGRENG